MKRMFLALICFSANADWIVVDGQKVDNVFIRETPSFYIVQHPADGSVQSVLKSKISPGQVGFSHDEEERNGLLAAWEAARANSGEPSLANPTAGMERKITASEFLQKRDYKKVAEFESALKAWSSLSPEFRLQMVSRLMDWKAQKDGADIARSRKLTEQQRSVQGKLTDNALQISGLQLEKYEALEDVYDDFDLWWNSEMLESMEISQYVNYLYDDPNPYTDRTIDEYRIKTHNDLARVQSNASAIRSRYGSAIGRLTSEQNDLLDVHEQVKFQRAATLKLLDRRQKTVADQISLLMAYEDAIEAEYNFTVPFRTIARFEGQGNGLLEDVAVTQSVWRVEWQIGQSTGRIRDFSIVITTAESASPATSAMSVKAPHERFLVLDDPGVYDIQVKAAEDVAYEVVVSQAPGP